MIGTSALALESEQINGNEVEGDFDFYSSELAPVSVGSGVQALAQRYTRTDIAGHGTTRYILYAWDGTSITRILDRPVKAFSFAQVDYEETLRFAPRSGRVSSIEVVATSLAAPDEPLKEEHTELQFAQARYR